MWNGTLPSFISIVSNVFVYSLSFVFVQTICRAVKTKFGIIYNLLLYILVCSSLLYLFIFQDIYIYIYIYIYILLWDYNRRGDKNYISKHIKRVGQPNNKSRNNLLYANKHKLKRNLSNE